MEQEESFSEGKLVNRDLLILLNERYRNLDISIEKMVSQQSTFQKDFIDLKIEVERIKTTGRIYTSIIAFISGIGASVLTSLILRFGL